MIIGISGQIIKLGLKRYVGVCDKLKQEKGSVTNKHLFQIQRVTFNDRVNLLNTDEMCNVLITYFIFVLIPPAFLKPTHCRLGKYSI